MKYPLFQLLEKKVPMPGFVWQAVLKRYQIATTVPLTSLPSQVARGTANKLLVLHGVAGYDQHLYISWDVGLLWALIADNYTLVRYYLDRYDRNHVWAVHYEAFYHYASLASRDVRNLFRGHFDVALDTSELSEVLLKNGSLTNSERALLELRPTAPMFLKMLITARQLNDSSFLKVLRSAVSLPTLVITRAQVAVARELLQLLTEQSGNYGPQSSWLYLRSLYILTGHHLIATENSLKMLLSCLGLWDCNPDGIFGRRYLSEVWYGKESKGFDHGDLFTTDGFSQRLFTSKLLAGKLQQLQYVSAIETLQRDLGTMEETGEAAYLHPIFNGRFPDTTIEQEMKAHPCYYARTPEDLQYCSPLLGKLKRHRIWATSLNCHDAMTRLSSTRSYLEVDRLQARASEEFRAVEKLQQLS